MTEQADKKFNPFAFVKEIQSGKHDLMEEDPNLEKEYKAFYINRALSYDYECLGPANIMNQRHHLDNKLQFHYLLATVRRGKRSYEKWATPFKNDDMAAVKEFFHFSDRKAMDALKILSEDQLKEIKRILDKGGIVKSKKT